MPGLFYTPPDYFGSFFKGYDEGKQQQRLGQTQEMNQMTIEAAKKKIEDDAAIKQIMNPAVVTPPLYAPPPVVAAPPQQTQQPPSIWEKLEKVYIQQGNPEKALAVRKVIQEEQTLNSEKYLKLGQTIHAISQAEKLSNLGPGTLLIPAIKATVESSPELKKSLGNIDFDAIKAKKSDDGLSTILEHLKTKDGPEAPYDLTLTGDNTGKTTWKLTPKKPIAENKNQTEEQLTAKALKGDVEAKAILDAMEKRRIDRESRLSALTDERASNRLKLTQDKSDRGFAVSLRKEFNGLPEIKESNLIMPKIKNMEKAFEESKKTNNFVAVDQALITLYNKLTDPSSVVRESEYARTAQNIPLINQIKGKFQKVLEGGAGLTQDERASLLKMARLMRQGYQEIRGNRIKEYRSYATQSGINGEAVISDVYQGQDSSGKKPLSEY